MKELLLFAYFLLVCSSVSSAPCEVEEPIRLDIKYSLTKIPIIDQGNLDICYAAVASQLVDFHALSQGKSLRFTKLTSFYSSAIHSKNNSFLKKARLHTRESGHQSLENYRICPAIEGIKKYGSCSQEHIISIFKKRFEFLRGSSTSYPGDYLVYLDIMVYQKKMLKHTVEEVKNTCSLAKDEDSLKYCSHLLSSLKKPSFLEFAKSMIEFECRGKTRAISKNIQCIDARFDLGYLKGRFIPLINKTLKKGIFPAISYCSGVLYKGKRFKGLGHFFPKKSCRPHTSIIIAKRSSHKRCEYLIRNTRGPICKYHADWKCENGDIWIDSKSLERNLLNITFLKEKK